jgi:hypothetical protein
MARAMNPSFGVIASSQIIALNAKGPYFAMQEAAKAQADMMAQAAQNPEMAQGAAEMMK